MQLEHFAWAACYVSWNSCLTISNQRGEFQYWAYSSTDLYIDILYTRPDPTTSVSFVQTFEIKIAKKNFISVSGNRSLFLAFGL